MPCNTRITNTVELNQKIDDAVMLKALQAQFGGYVDHNMAVQDPARRWFRFYVDGYTVTLSGGKVSAQLDAGRLEQTVGQVKQAYAVAAMQASAKRFGWAMKETTQAQAVQRRV